MLLALRSQELTSLSEMREVEGGEVRFDVSEVASLVRKPWSSKSISGKHMEKHYRTPFDDAEMGCHVRISDVYELPLTNH